MRAQHLSQRLWRDTGALAWNPPVLHCSWRQWYSSSWKLSESQEVRSGLEFGAKPMPSHWERVPPTPDAPKGEVRQPGLGEAEAGKKTEILPGTFQIPPLEEFDAMFRKMGLTTGLPRTYWECATAYLKAAAENHKDQQWRKRYLRSQLSILASPSVSPLTPTR